MHFKEVCTYCKTIVNQCRCPSNDKDVICKAKFTVIIVHYNTRELLIRATNSIPQKIPVIIVENGDISGSAWSRDKVIKPPTQMFHGDGLHFGIQHIDTPYFVTMDSDAYLKDTSIFRIMYDAFDKNTYGVGYVTKIDKHGHDDWNPASKPPYFQYLHPYFAMIHTQKYFECEPFVHHGAPGIYAMQSIIGKYNLKNLTNLSTYVHHDGRGTRAITSEYMKGWDIRCG